LDICTFSDGSYATDIVAPKSKYTTKEEFLGACAAEEYTDQWPDKVKIENVNEAYCRFFPAGIEGWEGDSGCYSFCKQGVGAFPVWTISLQR
jgi:hypothetical protein